ncbi:hypothetical protein GCM10022261_21740 [Brevibacterium daeguense]|uniref:DUF485 domain-containing protein n=1 Tax=Brevibacterium daeguense TaxID=909936 RepID=A0ABP8EL15_9MICO
MEQNTTHAVDYPGVQQSEKFTRLRRRHRSFVVPVSIAFLAWYFLYVLLGAYAHDLMAQPVLGNINVGVVLGLGQFVTTFAITMAYVSYANRRLDPLAAELRDDLEQIEAQAAADSTAGSARTTTGTTGTAAGSAGAAGTETAEGRESQ